MKKCTCETFPTPIRGRHHSRYCDMWSSQYLVVANEICLPDNAWFFLIVKQCGVSLVKCKLVPQHIKSALYAYKLGRSKVSFSRRYKAPGPMWSRQLSVVADADRYLRTYAGIQARQWSKRVDNQIPFGGDVFYMPPDER